MVFAIAKKPEIKNPVSLRDTGFWYVQKELTAGLEQITQITGQLMVFTAP